MEFAGMIIFISAVCLYIKLLQEPYFSPKKKLKILLIKEGAQYGRSRKKYLRHR